VGNIVPPATVTGATNSTAAAIEFAVDVLRVDDIVVCGHSQCGAIAALMDRLPADGPMPHLAEWLTLAAPVREVVETRYPHLTGREERLRVAEEENVLFAVDSLRTYPAVQTRRANGSLRLHGWFFKIATAELFIYAPDSRHFAPLT